LNKKTRNSKNISLKRSTAHFYH